MCSEDVLLSSEDVVSCSLELLLYIGKDKDESQRKRTILCPCLYEKYTKEKQY